MAEQGRAPAAGGKALRALGIAAAVVFMGWACIDSAGPRVERRSEFDSCQAADDAAAASQRKGLEAERDGEHDVMSGELDYQSRVIVANAECFPSDVVLDGRLRLDE